MSGVWRLGLAAALSAAGVWAQSNEPPGDNEPPTGVPFTCSAEASAPPTIRAEGNAELVGAVVITCEGGTPIPLGGQIPQGTITVTVGSGVGVASRLLAGNFSEALLLLDEPSGSTQYPCETPSGVCVAYGNGTGLSYYGPGPQSPAVPQNRNVYQGVLQGTNQLVFSGIPFDPPGRANTRTFRIENIRVNARLLQVPPGGGTAVTVTLAIGQGVNVPLENNVQTVAVARASFGSSVRDAANTTAVSDGVTVNTASPGAQRRVATLRFSELSANVFRARTIGTAPDPDTAAPPANQNSPGGIFRSETGFFNSSFGTYGNRGNLGVAGLADSGTRLRAVFDKVPEGARIFVTVGNESSPNEWLRLAAVGADGTGPFRPVAAAGGLAEVPVSGGRGVAVWEVLRSDGTVTGNMDVGVFVTHPAGLRSDIVMVSMDLAPVGGGGVTALPRFQSNATAVPLMRFDPAGAVLPSLRVTPAPVTFTAPQGGTAVSRELLVEALQGTVSANVDFNITQTGQFPVQLSSLTGRTPSRLNVSVSPGSLAPGRYTATLTVASQNVANSPLAVPVELTVTSRLSITDLAPNPVTAGRAGFALTVAGTGFVAGTTVRIGDQSFTPSGVTASQMTVQIPAELVAAPRSLPVVAVNPDRSESNVVPLVVNAAPVITSLNPDTVPPGQTASIQVLGRNFARGMAVQVGGQAVSSTFVDAGRFDAVIPANVLGSGPSVEVTVVATDGIRSNAAVLNVGAALRLEAGPVQAGDRGADATIRGTGFGSGVTVQATPPGGAPVTVTPSGVTPAAITLRLPANVLTQPGELQLRVVPAGGTPSGPLTLNIQPAPSISGLTPGSAVAGSGAFTLGVQGANFLNGSTVRWNGTALTTTFGSAGSLSAAVPAALVANRVAVAVTVEGPGGAASNSAAFNITLPALPGISYGGLEVATSASRADATLTLGAAYPAALRVQFTLTFRPDGNLPDDRTIVFTNGQRQIDVNLAAGSTGPAQVSFQTGSTAGVITLTPRFFAGADDVTPANVASRNITIARAAPAFAAGDLRCARSTATTLTVTLAGLSNTREVRQAAFGFEAAPGESLTASQFPVDVTQIFNAWFTNPSATGTFLYTQVFNVQPSTSAIASVSVTLTNTVGASAARTAQCTP